MHNHAPGYRVTPRPVDRDAAFPDNPGGGRISIRADKPDMIYDDS